jgi:hypothetical protein
MANTAVSALITKARRRVNEDSTTFFADADFIDFADEAQKYFVRQTRYLEGSSTTTAESGTQNYALPSDYLAHQRVTFDGKKLDRISYSEIDELNIDETDYSGLPTFYYILNEQIYLVPIPNTTDTIKIYYYKYPITLDATADLLETPPIYDDMIVCYMCYMAYKKDAESDISSLDFADYWMTECNVKIQQVKSDRQEDKLDRPVMFIPKRNHRVRTPLRDWK